MEVGTETTTVTRAASRFQRLTRRDVAFAGVVWVAAALVFFRYSIFGDSYDISGNDGDARLLIFIHEHWFRVAHGDASWLSPSFFYPATRTLGFSDTLLLDQVLYAPLRLMGFDQFASFQLTLVGLSLLGFAGWFVLARTVFGLSRTWAIWWAAIGAYANSLYVTADHAQLWLVNWVPWVVLATIAAVFAPTTRRRFGWGFSAGFLFALLAYSSFYVAWLALLASIIGFIVVLVVAGRRRIRRAIAAARSRFAALIGAAVGGGLIAIPFAMTYLPVLDSIGGRSYADAMFYSTRPRDIVNVSGSNYLWGSTVRSLLLPQRWSNTEYAMVATPILFAAALAAGGWAGFALFGPRRWRPTLDRRWAALSIASAVAMLAMTGMPIQFRWGSAWALPWHLMPGADAIRAIGRAALLATPLALVAIGALMQSVLVHRDSKRPGVRLHLAMLLLGALIVVEQFNTAKLTSISRDAQTAMLAAVPDPPDACESFYLVDSLPNHAWHAEIEAMLISHEVDLPTLNGYSGHAPIAHVFLDIYAEDYQQLVINWAAGHSLTGLCTYDRSTHTWAVR